MTRRRLLPFFLLGIATAAALPAAHHDEPTLSAAESVELVALLEDTRLEVLQKTAGLTDEQWTFKPAADRWSAADIVEHLMLVEQANLGAIHQAGKGNDQWAEKTTGKDAMLDKMLPDRSEKFQAPDSMQPTGAHSRAELIEGFLTERAKTVAMAADQKTPWKSRIVEGLPVGPLGAQQVMRLLARHTERHLKQLNEVLADSEFPR